jgi:hypothetical protein
MILYLVHDKTSSLENNNKSNNCQSQYKISTYVRTVPVPSTVHCKTTIHLQSDHLLQYNEQHLSHDCPDNSVTGQYNSLVEF